MIRIGSVVKDSLFNGTAIILSRISDHWWYTSDDLSFDQDFLEKYITYHE